MAAPSRVNPPGLQSAQAALRQGREPVVESLHREDVHGGAPLRAKSVEGDPIPHLVQRCREIARSGQLVVVDDATGAARLASGTGDVQQNEHGKVPPAPLALYVDGVIWIRTGPNFDVGVDCGVKIEILTLRLATVPFELRPEAGQRASQGPRVPCWSSVPIPSSSGSSSTTVHHWGRYLRW